MSFEALSDLLWRERELLEELLFALKSQQLVLLSEPARWLVQADAAVGTACDALRAHELSRAVEVDDLAKRLDLPVDATLADLVGFAPEPWSLTLDELHDTLVGLTADLNRLVTANRDLITGTCQTGTQTTLTGQL